MAVTEKTNNFNLSAQLDLSFGNINLTGPVDTWPAGDVSYGSFDVSPDAQISTSGGNLTWNTITDTTTYTVGGPWYTVDSNTDQNGKMMLRGEKADVDINGKSLKTWMEQVEQRLNILTPNPEMEKEWDELRRLGERYRRLEKKCQQKSDMWNQLKSIRKPVR